ncbi:hypothetical protein [Mycobacterium sp. UM_CSW]|uniref:hypothetical protein n=1 Tax=Mycobacterium sp. UM_CSW TaxID=1370119 RepID=UPI00040AC216|nr:hypothetical protein [Mycobacterium sp. UM_CSW]
MDDIPKTVTWILGGSSVPAAVLALVGLAPRLSAAYPGWVQAAIFLILGALLFGSIAGVVYLATEGRRESWLGRHIPLAFVALGLTSTILATAVLAVSYNVLLDIPDVPRLALTITATDPDVATAKVKFEADNLRPGNFIVVDVIAVGVDTPAPAGECHPASQPDGGLVCPVVPGHRVYRAAIGSDANGQIDSEIQTQLSRSKYRLVVAQVYPGPLQNDNKKPNDAEATTSFCADIVTRTPRSCAYVEVPPVDKTTKAPA